MMAPSILTRSADRAVSANKEEPEPAVPELEHPLERFTGRKPAHRPGGSRGPSKCKVLSLKFHTPQRRKRKSSLGKTKTVGDAKSMGRRGAYVADTIGCRKNRPDCHCDEGAMISRSRVRCRKSLDALYAIYRLIIAGNSFTRCSSLSLTRHFFACRAPSFLA